MIYTAYAKSSALKLIFDNQREHLDFLEQNDGKKFIVTIKRETGVRTEIQNNALHLYYTLLAKELNEGGFTCKYILGEKTVELDWTVELIKELIWRPIQIALTKKKSTTKLDKISEIDLVYSHLNRFFSNKPFCLYIPFPNDENKEIAIMRKI